MNDNKTNDQQEVINFKDPYFQDSFDLSRLDNFVTSLGAEYFHYKSMPSPIGMGDKGDYHRNDGVDTITSNGMVYSCSGKFNATMTDNSRDKQHADAGNLDPSQSRLVLPRFYNKTGIADGDRIYLSPGDRIYIADPTVDVLVSNPQRIQFEADRDNVAMFKIEKLELPILDSRNIQYTENVDFCITKDGNIRWLSGGKNPGIDPNTGKGRLYSVRYLYKAYWYITNILKEIRVTNVFEDGQRKSERMPLHAIAVREFVFHNQNRGDSSNQNKPKDQIRVDSAPPTVVAPGNPAITVDMSAIGDSE